jgi:prepilin-type processing-associated H-X9-DG protein
MGGVSDDEMDREMILRRRKRAVGLLLILVAVCVAVIGSEVRKSLNLSKCRSNLSAIGQAILVYWNVHHGQFPPDLGSLAVEEDITPAVFICPDSETSDPGSLQGEQLAAWVNANADYVYVGAGLERVAGLSLGSRGSANLLVAYEKDTNRSEKGMNVLFGDGRVEWLNEHDAQLATALNAANKPTSAPIAP